MQCIDLAELDTCVKSCQYCIDVGSSQVARLYSLYLYLQMDHGHSHWKNQGMHLGGSLDDDLACLQAWLKSMDCREM